jgi:hypothetical protein
MASMPITRTTCATLIRKTQRANNNNKSQAATKKRSRRDTCTTHHVRINCWTSSKPSYLEEPVRPSPATKKQVQATTTKNTIFGKIPLTALQLFRFKREQKTPAP